MYYTKIVSLLILFSVLSISGNAQQHIVLSKTKRDGNEKTKTIKLNQKVKVFYVSTERLSSSDRPPIVLHKKRWGTTILVWPMESLLK